MNVGVRAFAVIAAVVCVPAIGAAVQDDARLAEAALRSIATYPRYTVYDYVSAEATAGIVVLSGKVTLSAKRDEIAGIIATISGVRGVRNEIGVLPASAADDALRKKVSRAIYGSAAFWRYASWQNPPIHILVEGGHVTLIGLVPSDADRTAAQSLATGLGERSLTNALKSDRASAPPLRPGLFPFSSSTR